MKKFGLVLLLAILLVLAVFMFLKRQGDSRFKTIMINDSKIFVEIADDLVSRANGLSGRQSLPQNQGMLFIFETPGQYSFWMKGMLIPIDFVWIKDGAIVQMNENIQPRDYQPPKTLTPQKEINKVLELNAGTVERLKIKVGDKIEF